MQLLNQSAFLQSLGWAIAGSLWQMAALWLCYHLFVGLNKKAGATSKNLLATILLFTGSAWFLYSFFNKYYSLQNDVVVVLQGDKLQNQQSLQNFTATNGSLPTFLNNASGFIEQYLPYLSTAYLLVLAILFIRLLFAWQQSRSIKLKGLLPVDANWVLHFEHLVQQAGIHRKVSLWFSEKVDVPATIGFIKPVVLLPVAAFNQLTVEQAETILLHELGHIKRHDYLINLLVALSETILFFNPFAVLLATQLKKEREISCDEFVLKFRNQPETYATALLMLEQTRLQASPLLLKATGEEGQLLHRVKRIMNVPVNNFNYSQRLIAFLVTAGILSSLAWIKPAAVKKQNAANTIAQNNIAIKETGNKIILSPSIIEKRPGGDIVLFDEKKKNSLLVKIEKGKVKLIDEHNKVEFAADELELDKIPAFDQWDEKELAAAEVFTNPVPPMERESLPGKQMAPKEIEGFHFISPAEMPRLRIQSENLKREMRKRQNEWQFKAKAELEKAALAMNREYENLPTKEDWKRMQDEINRELEKINLQITLNEINQAKLDSALQAIQIVNQKRRVSFNEQKILFDLNIQKLAELKELSSLLNNMVIMSGSEKIVIPEPEEAPAIEQDEKEHQVKPPKQSFRYNYAPVIKISDEGKSVRKRAVIVSL